MWIQMKSGVSLKRDDNKAEADQKQFVNQMPGTPSNTETTGEELILVQVINHCYEESIPDILKMKSLTVGMKHAFWKIPAFTNHLHIRLKNRKCTAALTVRDSLLRPLVTKLKPWVSMATPVRWMCSSTYLHNKNSNYHWFEYCIKSTNECWRPYLGWTGLISQFWYKHKSGEDQAFRSNRSLNRGNSKGFTHISSSSVCVFYSVWLVVVN